MKTWLLKKIKENKSLVIFALALFAVRWSLADHYRVPTGSMEPTIQVGDHLLTNKVAFDFKLPFTEVSLVKIGNPSRGDVIVFRYPKDPTTLFVKRVVGLPGEKIKISNNKVYINGTELKEKYLPGEGSEFTYSQEYEWVIPDQEYFVMGDNRENSLDSRYWGFVKRELIKGRAHHVLLNVRLEENLKPHIGLDRVGKKLNEASLPSYDL